MVFTQFCLVLSDTIKSKPLLIKYKNTKYGVKTVLSLVGWKEKQIVNINYFLTKNS